MIGPDHLEKVLLVESMLERAVANDDIQAP